MAQTVFLIPGWHEKAHDLRTITHGRPGFSGLAARGFEPFTFELENESLPERIDRFAGYIRAFKAREPWRFPACLFGYSMGGIVARALFRRHPDLAADFSHLLLLAVPNWGLQLSVLPALARIAGLPWRELYEIEPENRFVPELNGTNGRFVKRGRERIWVPDREPWIAPAGMQTLAIAGVVPRYGDGDGLVSVDSATMGGRIPAVTVVDRHANHLNVTGETDTVAMVLRGFMRTDGVWPRVLDAFSGFARTSAAAAERDRGTSAA